MSTASDLPDGVNRYATFATLPSEQILDCKGLAYCLDCSPRTVQRRVRCKQLPPPIRMGNKWIWTVGQIREWFDKLLRKAEAAMERSTVQLRDFEYRR